MLLSAAGTSHLRSAVDIDVKRAMLVGALRIVEDERHAERPGLSRTTQGCT